MKKRVFAALMAGVMGTMMFGITLVSAEAETPELKGEVYAFIAASLNNAMEELQKNFNETYPDVEILYNADSSGTLQTQIEEGARCDIFFSAAQKQMNALVDEGLADKDSVVDLLENKVVLIKPKDGETKVTAVSEGSNEVGIVYATDAASVADFVDIIAEAPAGSLETPVLYPVGLVEDQEASDDDKAAAAAFLEYLQSDEALEVFEKYGFAAYVTDENADDAQADDAAEETEEAAEDTAE